MVPILVGVGINGKRRGQAIRRDKEDKVTRNVRNIGRGSRWCEGGTVMTSTGNSGTTAFDPNPTENTVVHAQQMSVGKVAPAFYLNPTWLGLLTV